jgi:long-chain acyl-CoA synthetase
MYTSGTTGNPKGVMLTHGSFLKCLEDYDPFTSRVGSKRLCILPVAHVFELLMFWLAAKTGGHSCVF